MRILLVLTLALVVGHDAVAADAKPAGDSQRSAVLVTGASAGIGRKVTERLAAEVYYVFAGARKKQGLNTLDTVPGLQLTVCGSRHDQSRGHRSRGRNRARRGPPTARHRQQRRVSRSSIRS